MINLGLLYWVTFRNIVVYFFKYFTEIFFINKCKQNFCRVSSLMAKNHFF